MPGAGRLMSHHLDERPEDIRFRDDPDQLVVLDDREVPDPPVGHEAHAVGDGRVGRHGHQAL